MVLVIFAIIASVLAISTDSSINRTIASSERVRNYNPMSLVDHRMGTNVRIVDKELEPYVSSFEKLWGQKINYKVMFVNSTTKTVGLCELWNPDFRLVEIDRKYFKSTNESGREQLIFHELGHCSLDRRHRNNTTFIKNNLVSTPASIMIDRVFSKKELLYYKAYRDYYINELFNYHD